ncbi:TetR/AcrR family transcriptional regulator [Streptomyces endophyticus]|uniref:TetR/AcrR family transcriptional regulator n=1 Tax=Streptomyces endophyticus TaxID=714166 RepID=A0ABU6FFT8_9ACTN|nr:TetR/AcrR family transcriptional regulator [Streptomyces endophyticus]MEB8342908.1 TetR/AcrR family transcriptional regulator [Streptomyces endophyticus]
MTRKAERIAAKDNAWQWSRTEQTRRTLLDAAREVFCEQGFTDTAIVAVVRRAGSSVGSLYHHFGGKTELFVALWEDYENSREREAAEAVAAARAAGETDPLELFLVGTRSFLEGCWRRRDLIELWMDGDGPPGFELMRRARGREWIRQNAVLLEAGSEPVDRLVVGVLTSVIGEAGREIGTCARKRDADAICHATLALIRRLDPLHIDPLRTPHPRPH